MRHGWVLLGAALVVVACSGGGSGGVGGGGGNIESFRQEWCALYQPCCQQAGLRTDGSQCQAWVTLAASQGSYDPAAGSACINDTRALGSEFCTTGKSPPSCKGVFRSGGSTAGSKQPGEACSDDDDCAASSEGEVECASSYSQDAGTTRMCQVRIEGKAGDTPCIGTRDGNVTSYSGSRDNVSRGYICDLAKNIRCDSQTQACTALANVDEPCNGSDSACVANAYCEFTSKKCVARIDVGGDCSKSSTACVENAYCDYQNTKTCIAKLETGAACSNSQACVSSRCVNGKCEAGSSSTITSLSIICGKP